MTIKLTTEIILIRHGETELNMKKVYFGHLNPLLHKFGKIQAEKTKEKINDEIDIIFSSDLSRCIKTAEIINKKFDKKIIPMKELRELNFGVFEGKSYADIQREFPKESGGFFQHWKDYEIPEGESVKNLYERCNTAIAKIISENKGKKILIVTHLGCIQSILAKYICDSIEGYWKFYADYASMTKLILTGDFMYAKYINK